ncbi:MAG: CTP synthase [Defluviitaleaceae bacterium]|nr:CTP synthase [Defluviitaleaceae bacterium]
MQKTKYIFITGGVASGLGKGITAASLGRLLKSCGYKITNQKFDPYINVDPGRMSPIQHGEVFVTDDGAQCDLDIGNYERFIDENLNINSNITAGKIYQCVLEKELKGEYEGVTVQVVPHVTDYIQQRIRAIETTNPELDIVITEIGGTVGDFEGLPFLEAIRQLAFEIGRENVLYIHVTLLPYLAKGGEIKTKPTQHSVKQLLSFGIQPDIIVCRTERKISDEMKRKIALYCNVSKDCIIQNIDCECIYEVPLLLKEENFAEVVECKLGFENRIPDLGDWRDLVNMHKKPDKKIKIALVGKYALRDAYLSLMEAIKAAGTANKVGIEIDRIEAEDIEKEKEELLKGYDGIIIGGGFGERGYLGKILAAKFARQNNIPCLGIGMGFHAMAIEFAKNVMGMENAQSQELNPDANSKEAIIKYTHDSNLRLGAFDIKIAKKTKAMDIYKEEIIQERHRNRYEFNLNMIPRFEKHGMIFPGISGCGNYAEIMEMQGDNFYMGCAFHPEFKSRPNRPHGLFQEFVLAAIRQNA